MNTDPDFQPWLTFAVGDLETIAADTPVDLLGQEGGWSPDDPSADNPTMRGVEYNEACAFFHTDVDSMSFSQFQVEMTRTVVGEIADTDYWQPARVSLLPRGPRILYMDHCWNAGLTAGVQCLQRAINATGFAQLDVDGDLGPLTEAAMRSLTPADAVAIITTLHAAIEADYKTDSEFTQYGSDWLRRNDAGQVLALQLAKGTA